uniref:GCR062 n=1 Tax=Schmidtea mediterranea TaxID=79327 RepID=A0A193KUH8_SCHMD|nr:GCR062 [Schmidtea mediterranea]
MSNQSVNSGNPDHNNGTFCNTLTYSMSWSVIAMTLSVAVSVITIAGNILVITAFALEKKLRVIGNYFIVSLAATDLLIGLFSMNLFTVYLLLGCWPLGQFLCDLWLSVDYTACLTSQCTVLSITVDRYCSVKIPNIYRSWRTGSKVIIMVAIAWLVPSILFFTAILGWPLFTIRKRLIHECFADFTSQPVFNTLLTVGYFWVPLFIMLFLYYGIYNVACNLQKKSDERHKKMTTLMAMAGQTMSRIGVGVNWNNNESENHPRKDSGNYLQTEKHPTCSSNAHKALPNDLDFKMKSNTSETKLYSSPDSGKCIEFMDNEEIKLHQLDREENQAESSSQNTESQTHEGNKFPDKSPTTYITDSESGAGPVNQSISAAFSSSLMGVLKKPYYNKFVKRSKRNKTISRSENRARKAFRTISLILGAFLACWTPYHVLVMIKGFCYNRSEICVNDHLYNISYWLCYMNSPINPFCYALANIQFKRTFIRLMKGDLHRC